MGTSCDINKKHVFVFGDWHVKTVMDFHECRMILTSIIFIPNQSDKYAFSIPVEEEEDDDLQTSSVSFCCSSDPLYVLLNNQLRIGNTNKFIHTSHIRIIIPLKRQKTNKINGIMN